MLMDRAAFREAYLKIIDPLDARWNYENYELGLWVKHQVAHYVDPLVIVEIGVRSGYSAWAMKQATPKAVLFGYDSYSPEYGKGCGVGLSEQFEAWARKMFTEHLGQTCHLIKQDSQDPAWQPRCADLYHVDGDHHYEAAYSDVCKCLAASHDKSIVIVHDYQAKPVRNACRDAAEEFGFTVFEISEPRNGDGLIFKGLVPVWAMDLEVL